MTPFTLAADPHGTAVAEVIHDMAPGADLLLACWLVALEVWLDS